MANLTNSSKLIEKIESLNPIEYNAGEGIEIITTDNAITNTGVLSVNGQTGDVTIASPDMSNYLAKNNTTSFTPTGDYHPATKKYVDDTASGKVSDTAYASSWDGVTNVAPSKNAVYDKLASMDTTIGNKANTSDLPSAMTASELNTGTSTTGRTISAALLKAGITGAINAKIDTREYSSSWDGSEKAPTQNAVYDKINAMDTTIGNKANTSDLPSDMTLSELNTGTSTTGRTVSAILLKTAITGAIKGKADKTEVLTKTNTTSFTPDSDYQPATKKYVDDAVAGTSSTSTLTLTLLSTGWNSSKQQTLNATGVTASNTVIVSPAPANIGEYTGAGIYCSAQASGTLTFTCASLPDNDIPVNVVILG